MIKKRNIQEFMNTSKIAFVAMSAQASRLKAFDHCKRDSMAPTGMDARPRRRKFKSEVLPETFHGPLQAEQHGPDQDADADAGATSSFFDSSANARTLNWSLSQDLLAVIEADNGETIEIPDVAMDEMAIISDASDDAIAVEVQHASTDVSDANMEEGPHDFSDEKNR